MVLEERRLEEKRRQIQKLKAEEAFHLLESELKKIRHVEDWANLSGCSTKSLQHLIKKRYGRTAKVKLELFRFSIIKIELENNPDITSFALALNTGLKDEKALYKFLSRNFDTSFTELKHEVLKKRALVARSDSKGIIIS